MGFGNKTPLASPDHYQAMLITDAAVFYSRLSKWDEHFEGLPVHTICSQLYFDLSFESRGWAEFGSHITVDIGDELERKIESILCYKTQFPPEKTSRRRACSGPCDCCWRGCRLSRGRSLYYCETAGMQRPR